MSAALAGLAGFQIISGLQQSEMIRMQADIQRDIDAFNAELAEEDAWRIEQFGQTQVARYQSEIDQAEGTARVRAAAVGADITEGSLSEITQENFDIGFLNKLEIENQAREQALGYRKQISSARMQSTLNYGQAQVQARSVIGGAIGRAGGTLASGYKPKPDSPLVADTPSLGSSRLGNYALPD